MLSVLGMLSLNISKMTVNKAVIPQRLFGNEGDRKFKVTRVYCDDDGKSKFADFNIDLLPSGLIGSLSKLIPTKGIIFRTTPGNYDYNWHQAPRRQFVINLDASLEIEVSSGEKRIIPQGGVFLLEDTQGEGHKSRSVDNKPRTSLFIPVSDEFKVN
ncbi:hypothetical protein LOD99_14054 [Oopsacas minuta]|uniref:Uncharacterized protein n=1 Tax=Oopsacas minuta TaxID=111878 RepID=A0AAV7KJU3_9METZ|nr:hypothetical protein LOD99_14054 [Oopsacas minuta]